MSEVKRQPVNYRYDALNHNFLKLLAEIAKYAGDKYGSPQQYAAARLTGEKSPINHIYEHLRAYQDGELHDHFGTMKHQLAAIAYNAMMSFLYDEKFGYELGVIARASLPNVPVNDEQPPPIPWEADEQVERAYSADAAYALDAASTTLADRAVISLFGASQAELDEQRLQEYTQASTPFTPLNQPGGKDRLIQILKEAQERANGEL